MITVPAIMCLSKIASCTEFLLVRYLFLQLGMKYSDLFFWYEEEKLKRSEKESLANGTHLNSTGSAIHKVPIFKVPTFYGDTLKGDKFIKKIEYIFINSAMAAFINNRKYCNNHPEWSFIFASLLRDSIANSTILGYLATELDT